MEDIDSRSIENPSFDLNSPATWDMFLEGTASASGVPVTHGSAMKLAAVWQAVSMISGDIAKLPLRPMVVGDHGVMTPDEYHPSFVLTRYEWNEETSAFDGWRTLAVHCLIWGDGYAYIERNGRGDPIGLYNLLPDRTRAERLNGQLVYVTETTSSSGSQLRPIEPGNILHVRGISFDGIAGLDLIQYARDAMGTALATEGFQAKYFKNGIRSGGILMLPREMPNEAKRKVEEGFASTYSGQDNWFKTVVLRDGAKFESTQASLAEAQMVQLDEQLVRKVARFFNLSPSRLGLSDSVSYNSKAEDNQSYLDGTLSHWLIPIADQCRMKLFSRAMRDSGTRCFQHDTTQLLRMNDLSRYQVYAMARQNKILTVNEIRAKENMPPVDGGDDIHMDAAPAGGADKGGFAPGRGVADATGGNVAAESVRSVDDQTAEKRRVVYAIAARARAKAASSPKAFLDWVDGGLVSYRGTEAANTVVDEMVAELRSIAQTATAETLVDVVGERMTKKELAS